ncbi:MAG: 2-succinyl-5-enolpyruvyl-6-hydroxy-3-cyclohexene-1-carboxylic-acid synthase, partial [Puniceicoccales bacterium]
MHPLLRANQNTVWGGLIVEALAHCGLKRAVISPGSRSTPLTMAFALEDRVECTVILDERSAAFYALGCAKATGEPVALLCTSGTAAANYLPAIIEAHYSGAPLIVLTADRPPELRDCAAGQTIDQVKLFGDYVHFYHEMSLPPMEPVLGERHDYAIRMVTHAYGVALNARPGPVHLNVPFRDPLAPVEGKLGGPFPAINKARLPFSKALAAVATKTTAEALPFYERDDLLVVVGPPDANWSEEERCTIARLCARRGWPVIADVSSGLRGLGAECGTLIGAYDSILRDPVERHELRPGALLFIGPLPTRKILRSYLRENARLPSWRLGTGQLNVNASYGPVVTVPVSLSAIAVADGDEAPPTALAGRWLEAEANERRRLKKQL